MIFILIGIDLGTLWLFAAALRCRLPLRSRFRRLGAKRVGLVLRHVMTMTDVTEIFGQV